ncbi:MAG: GNAT family N-acetyltransferase [Clostridia bacterium]|nr:GNAT family N-acetyltransferase [Clostridia bacterium]
MNDIVFRAATREDIPTICKFRVTQLSRGGTVEVPDIDAELKGFFNKCFDDNTIHQIFAFKDGEAIATGAVLFFAYPPSHVNRSGLIAYISNMFTLPEYRKQGLGTHILGMLEDEARRRGVKTAKLGATPMGKSLYVHAGYGDDDLHTLIKKL